MSSNDLICIAAITGAKGLRGQVRLKTFTEDPLNIATYKNLVDDHGNPITLSGCTLTAKEVVASVAGIHNRTQAESLRGTQLFIHRNQLPDLKEEDLYYITDLIGLDVRLPNDEKIGTIRNVHNFGAGDILEFHHDQQNQEIMIPFKKEFVPEVNIREKWIHIDETYVEDLLDSGDDA